MKTATLAQKSAVLDRVRECWKLANALPDFAGFPCPAVYFYDKRRAAGLANLRTHMVGIHETLLVENFDSMIHETVAHEVAHLVVHWRWRQRAFDGATSRYVGKRPAPHGCEWKAVMRRIFGVEPERTHAYDMSSVAVRRQRRWAYACPCRTHKIPTARHNKISAGKTFVCSACRGTLNFLGEVA